MRTGRGWRTFGVRGLGGGGGYGDGGEYFTRRRMGVIFTCALAEAVRQLFTLSRRLVAVHLCRPTLLSPESSARSRSPLAHLCAGGIASQSSSSCVAPGTLLLAAQVRMAIGAKTAGHVLRFGARSPSVARCYLLIFVWEC
ncbi:hypothetical protein ACFE04_029085 [Oxalis oulophora]